MPYTNGRSSMLPAEPTISPSVQSIFPRKSCNTHITTQYSLLCVVLTQSYLPNLAELSHFYNWSVWSSHAAGPHLWALNNGCQSQNLALAPTCYCAKITDNLWRTFVYLCCLQQSARFTQRPHLPLYVSCFSQSPYDISLVFTNKMSMLEVVRPSILVVVVIA